VGDACQPIRPWRLRARLITCKVEEMIVGKVEGATTKEGTAVGRASGVKLEIKETAMVLQEGV
jgi:hypothetical protein